MYIVKLNGGGLYFMPETAYERPHIEAFSDQISGDSFAELLKRVSMPMNPTGTGALAIGDLNDDQITAMAHKWAETVAEHYGCTLGSYKPHAAERTSRSA